MSSIDLDYLHELQLQLAEEVKRICEKHKIPFFLVDGSALGALNLSDFLPWDDDLDIGMYWPDYQRFLQICKTELNPRFKMKDFTIEKSFGCCFGQLINSEVKLIQKNNQYANDEKGVFIDIHPFSNCSDIKVFRIIEYYLFKICKIILLQKRNYLSESNRFRTLISIVCRIIPEKAVIKIILIIRNRKRGTMAQKIHGRHKEDYIILNNLHDLKTISFHGKLFYVQPDAKRMLDSIYGEFDIKKEEVNRHNIITLEGN